ncbi:TPA: hypothetical protein ACPHXU_001145, partial [Legionella anisa]
MKKKVRWSHKPPIEILNALAKNGVVGRDGSVSFKAGGFRFNDIDYLIDSINFGCSIDEQDKITAVKQTIKKCFNKGGISEKKFIDLLTLEVENFLNKRKELRYFITGLSILKPSFNKIQINESTIRFYKTNIPRKFSSRVNKLKEVSKNNIKSNYCSCVIETVTFSNEIDIPLKNLNILRALFCLYNNYDFEFLFSKKRMPLNRVRIDEFHTLHNKEGLVENNLYYEIDFIEAPIIEIPQSKKFFETIISLINKSPYKEVIIDSLIFYVKAFDSYDPNISLILAWNAIDKLTNSESGNYNNVINRFRGIVGKTKHSEIIQILKNVRNNYVHRIEEHKNARDYCYELQSYFKLILEIHLQYLSHLNLENAFKVLDHLFEYKNSEEYISFFNDEDNSNPLIKI